MKYIRFYEEFGSASNKRKGISEKNVAAVFVGNGKFFSGNKWCYDAISGIFDYPNSAVASGAISLDYLSDTCKRISEQRAREIHPALFKRLDTIE